WVASGPVPTARVRRRTTCACTATSAACSRSMSSTWNCRNASPPATCCARCRATCWPKPQPGAATACILRTPRNDVAAITGTKVIRPHLLGAADLLALHHHVQHVHDGRSVRGHVLAPEAVYAQHVADAGLVFVAFDLFVQRAPFAGALLEAVGVVLQFAD